MGSSLPAGFSLSTVALLPPSSRTSSKRQNGVPAVSGVAMVTLSPCSWCKKSKKRWTHKHTFVSHISLNTTLPNTHHCTPQLHITPHLTITSHHLTATQTTTCHIPSQLTAAQAHPCSDVESLCVHLCQVIALLHPPPLAGVQDHPPTLALQHASHLSREGGEEDGEGDKTESEGKRQYAEEG